MYLHVTTYKKKGWKIAHNKACFTYIADSASHIMRTILCTRTILCMVLGNRKPRGGGGLYIYIYIYIDLQGVLLIFPLLNLLLKHLFIHLLRQLCLNLLPPLVSLPSPKRSLFSMDLRKKIWFLYWSNPVRTMKKDDWFWTSPRHPSKLLLLMMIIPIIPMMRLCLGMTQLLLQI